MTAIVEPVEHRVIKSDSQSTFSGPSTTLTCLCGWRGHSTRWSDLDHAARGGDVPALPRQESPLPVSRTVLREAIYGTRRRQR